MRAAKIHGWMIVVCALIYTHIQTNFHGNHFLPQSDSEIIADGIGLIAVALGLLIVAVANSKS